MRRRAPIMPIVFSISLAIIFCASTIFYASRTEYYERYIAVQGERALSQLLTSISAMETALEKLQYAPSGTLLSTLTAEIWVESENAKSALSQLPLDGEGLDTYEKFIAQAGDYSYFLMRQAASGQVPEEDSLNTLFSLSESCSALTSTLASAKEQVDAGVASVGGMLSTLGDSGVTAGTHLHSAQEDFPEYASLIYDGPYSDHIEKQSAKFIEGMSELSEQQAHETLAEMPLASGYTLTPSGEIGGNIPAYAFGGGDIYAQLTKNGGVLLSFIDSRQLGEGAVTLEEALSSAAGFLEQHGFVGMQSSYYTIYERVVTINFAYSENDIMAYTDLIKVSVALDNGRVVRFDSRGYVISHHERTPPQPSISLEQSYSAVPANVQLVSSELAIIPTAGKNEVLCYEHLCKTDLGHNVLIYVNAQTGMQENIFLLIESENGTLTL